MREAISAFAFFILPSFFFMRFLRFINQQRYLSSQRVRYSCSFFFFLLPTSVSVSFFLVSSLADLGCSLNFDSEEVWDLTDLWSDSVGVLGNSLSSILNSSNKYTSWKILVSRPSREYLKFLCKTLSISLNMGSMLRRRFHILATGHDYQPDYHEKSVLALQLTRRDFKVAAFEVYWALLTVGNGFEIFRCTRYFALWLIGQSSGRCVTTDEVVVFPSPVIPRLIDLMDCRSALVAPSFSHLSVGEEISGPFIVWFPPVWEL